MDDETRTFPMKRGGFPVRALRVEVISGPDIGQAADGSLDRIRVGTADGNDLALTDPTVSRFHLEVVRRDERIAVIDHGSTNGTRIGPVHLRAAEVSVDPGAVIEIGATRIRVEDGAVLMMDLGSVNGFHGVIGRSPAIRRLTASLEKLSSKDASVLLIGESGTGKEVLARAVHNAGNRKSGPLVTLDCGAISPSLFVSELMGHERGAFTGADRTRPGAFERAHQGTLFIDEVGELPLEMQTALLGVIERRRVLRVGAKSEVPVDVRVIAATNRDLKAAVNAGKFRLDLYFRLAVVTLHVPPLRERPDDISLLLEHFLREEGDLAPVETHFDASKIGELKKHDWPGNVRELKNFVLATLATGEMPAIQPLTDVAASATGLAWPHSLLDARYRDARRQLSESFEPVYLRRLMDRAQGNIREAARLASMDRSYLMDLLARHGFR
jgi:DNA-binding NtrC family response regulator